MDLITESENIRGDYSLTDSSAKTNIRSAYNKRSLDRDYKEIDEEATSQEYYDKPRNSINSSVGGYNTNNKNTSNIKTNTYSDMTNTYNNFNSNDRNTVNKGTNRNNVYSTNRSTDYNAVYSNNNGTGINQMKGGQPPLNNENIQFTMITQILQIILIKILTKVIFTKKMIDPMNIQIIEQIIEQIIIPIINQTITPTVDLTIENLPTFTQIHKNILSEQTIYMVAHLMMI
jgi:hypothetical protein